MVVDSPLGGAGRPGAGRPAAQLGRDATFHYAIPPELEDQVAPGQLVWVPFGRRRLQGIVIALATTSPVERNRDILAVVDPRPALAPADIALARWLNAHYLAPFFECLRLFLPPGGLGQDERRFARTDRPALTEALRALSPEEQQVFGLFTGARDLSEDQVRARLRGQGRAAPPAATIDAALDSLVQAGWLAAETHLADPRTRPKRVRVVQQLAFDPDEIDTRLRSIRKRRAADVLAYLRRPEAELPTVDEVVQATGCPRSVLADLAERGLVAPDPDYVLLAVRGVHAREAELALRGVEVHAAVLDGLAALGGTATLPQLRAVTPAPQKCLAELERVGLIHLGEEQVWRDPLAGLDLEPAPAPELTEDQAKVWPAIARMLGQGSWAAVRPLVSFSTRPKVALVHGVTGSGKTELYLRAIEQVLDQGRQALVLVPEIALTAQQVRRFASRFPGRVGVWHSELSDGERRDTWHRAQSGLLDVIIGSRSAVFAPLARLGLIILDEEHADAYKQDRTPRYHARDVAIHRAALTGATVILGSATPMVESFWEAERGAYTLLALPRRVATSLGSRTVPDWGVLPPVHIVDMRAELRAGNISIFSRPLHQALAETLAAGGQAILYLNRRGNSTFVLCRDCGHVQSCPRCHSPLTWHSAGGALVCHHCNLRSAPPMLCPACGSGRIRYFGAGTERVEEVAREAFPEARIIRWDADTTGKRGAHEAILARFVGGRADILVGTQMIAKGLDLPRVTLVGVVSADTGLHFPDFRSSERSFQLLSQVAGRAGRSTLGGQVILQTYAPEHPAIVSAAAHDYAGFYRREIAFRAENRYPPFSRLVRLLFLAPTPRAAREESERMAQLLRGRIERLGLAETGVIGPAPAFFARERGRARWQLLVRSPDPHALLAEVAFGPGWRVDVDPVDVL